MATAVSVADVATAAEEYSDMKWVAEQCAEREMKTWSGECVPNLENWKRRAGGKRQVSEKRLINAALRLLAIL